MNWKECNEDPRIPYKEVKYKGYTGIIYDEVDSIGKYTANIYGGPQMEGVAGIDYEDKDAAFATEEEAKSWVENWLHKELDTDTKSGLSEEKVTELNGYTIHHVQTADSDWYEVWKNGKRCGGQFETEASAQEYIKGMYESLRNTIKAKLTEKLHRDVEEKPTLDYEDMKSWNPVAIGSKIAEFLGQDATLKQIRSEVGKIIVPENFESRESYKKARGRAIATAMNDLQVINAPDDPMKGHKYRISGVSPNVTETGVDYDIQDAGFRDDPKEAIEEWLKLSKTHPTEVSISTNKNAYADELLKWVVDHEPEFTKMYTGYDSPYDLAYLLDACKKGRKSDFEINSGYFPDQIFPFCLG